MMQVNAPCSSSPIFPYLEWTTALYPTMQCARLDLPCPVWQMNQNYYQPWFLTLSSSLIIWLKKHFNYCPLPECFIEGNFFPSCLWSIFLLCLSGDAYFFKNNSYWVLKSGELDQDIVSPGSTAVDWMKCPEPTPTKLPDNPRQKGDCNCGLNGALQMSASSWLLSAIVLLYPGVFI